MRKTDQLIRKLRSIKNDAESLRVRDVMTRDVLTIEPDRTVINASEKMLENRIHSLIVTEGNKPVGIITSYDILLVMSISDFFDKTTPVGKVMVRDLVTISPDASLEEALKKMIEYNIRTLVVVENENLAGILSLIDIVLGYVDTSRIPLDLDVDIQSE
ncbi:MAG: CBS domain-containing protein [Candidatus Altiarchaeales archaeon]|nr:MAG: CBS domain-containing protein [Candidatus Altiarchaeales archaeon]RLI93815.1 MAG: CBS domain-containing protein [Candidatus Altiarchaeales archaeon]RLI94000.1 MAG: CBS domain-containing protein [Candidatus Altiarchaeales archaeon]HDO82779.1 CBS domain-containing protein [Candidatus Altiarchaeales archaeon]HEX55428.1 CBS domain-containing protein [Candidatus Altiarchaeales archaeon]